MTEAEFREGMAILATAFPSGVIDEPRIKLYWRCLQDLEPQAWAAGVLHIVRELKFFPTIAELRDAAEPRVTLRAARMFDQVVALRKWRAGGRHDGWPSLELVGERLGQAAMEAYQVAGGPAGFHDADTRGDMTWVRKTFLEEYRTARTTGVQDVATLPPDPRFLQLAARTAGELTPPRARQATASDYKRLAAGEGE